MTTNSADFLEQASSVAFAKLDDAGGELLLVEEPFRTIVIINSAQGIIDNGGLEYFFESDFPENTSYQLFIEAYRKIGAIEEAEIIAKSLLFFPMSKPELDIKGRSEFLQTLPADFSHEFSELSGKLCGNTNVWLLLERYAENNKGLIVKLSGT